MKRKLLSLLLALVMVLSMVPATAFASPMEELSGSSETIRNPLYVGCTEELLNGASAKRLMSDGSGTATLSEEDYISDTAVVLDNIAAGMEARQASIVIRWEFPQEAATTKEELQTLLLDAFYASMGHTGIPTRGDYLAWSWSEVSFSYSLAASEAHYLADIVYHVTYYTSAAQEAELTAKIDEVIAGFGFTETTDVYTAVKAVYDYICDNVDYDYSTNSDLLKHTAYAAMINGKAVCQGYSALLYRMLLELGVDCRIITGDTDGDGESDHAWNIVGMSLFYYNADSTWDATSADYRYFLRCPENFASHVRDEAYDTEEFHSYYPMADKDYVYGEEIILDSGTCGEGVNWKLDAEGILTVSGEGAMADYNGSSGTPWYGNKDNILGVVIEKGVTHVGKYAFCDCDNLFVASVGGAKTIGKGAFSDCANLLAVDLLEGVEEIGEEAFRYGYALEAVSVPATLKKSGTNAFGKCNALRTVIINDLSAWCGIQYAGSSSMPMQSAGQLYLGDEPITDLVIPEDVTAITSYAFRNVQLNSVAMHNGVTQIGVGSFQYTSVKALTLSNQLEEIPDKAFENHLLDTLTIPEGVKVIKSNAFNRKSESGIIAIEKLWLPATIETIERSGIDAENIYIPDLAAWCGVTLQEYYNDDTRSGADATGLYVGGQRITELTIPEGVREIKPYAFFLMEITKLTLPDSVETVGESVFKSCPITQINWGSGLKTIGNNAFYYTDLLEIVLPSNVETVGANAFKSVPAKKILLNEGLLSIKDSAFESTAITSIVIPDSVTDIGWSAFSGCESLQKVTIGDGVSTIGSSAFAHCTELTTLQMGNNVETIGDHAFYDTEVSGKIHFGQKLKTVGTRAFENLRQLEEVIFPATLTTLDYQAFAHCYSLQQITFLGEAPTKARESFSGITTTANIPCTATTWTQDARGQVGMGGNFTWKTVHANQIVSPGKAPTCTESGLEDVLTCGDCGKILETQKVIPALGHSNVTDGVCGVCGEEVIAITQQPVDVSVGKGQTAKVTVVAEGDGLTYQWYVKNKGASSFAASSIKTAVYSAAMDAARDGRQVYCVITDKYGTVVRTDTVTMTMLKPEITTQPESVKAKLDESVKVSFTAEGEGLKYEWYYKDAGASKFTKTSTFTGPEYTTTMTEARAGRQIYCVVTDKYGTSVQTNTVTLTLDSEVVITKQPTDVTVAKGQTAEVSFAASGLGLKYEWYFKNAGETKFTKTSTFTSNSYTTEMNEVRAGRQIYCVVTDKFGNTAQTETVTLGMLPLPEITVQPQSVKAKLNESLTVSFTAEGEDLKYEWYYKDAGATKFTKTSTFTGPEYTTTMTEARAGRQIYCVVTDKYGVSVQTNTVTLALDSEITITKQPADVTVAKGQMAEVSFTASGLGLTYEWYFKNAGETKFTKTTTFTGPEYSAQMNEARAGRQIYCVVTDKYGASVQTETVTLGMLPLPEITVQLEGAKAKLGENLKVSFTAEGEGLKYEWYYKNAGASSFIKTSTFSSNYYEMEMTEARAGRQIYCVVTDKYGVSVQTNTVTLALDSEITITKQPADVTVAKGQMAEVSFTASGLGLKYEWYFKNAGETKFTKTTTFTGPEYSAQMNEARAGRQIYCVVTDKYGTSVQTDTVTLGMLPLPEITVQPESVKGKDGETVTVSFTAEGEDLTYEWYYKNKGETKFTKTSTFTGPEYTTAMNTARAGRQIYCVVTDKYGVSVQTETVTLQLDTGLAITKQPESVTAASGKTVTVSFTAEGEGLKYEWYYKNKGETKFTKTSTFTGPEYTTVMNATRAGRQIYCVVTDKYGTSVQTDTVTLNMA